MTNNHEFINYTFETLKILLKKSMLISEISEKTIQLFFHTLRAYMKKKIIIAGKQRAMDTTTTEQLSGACNISCRFILPEHKM